MYYARTALYAGIALFIAACDPTPPPAETPDEADIALLGPGRVATINGERIPESLFRFYVLNQLGTNPDELSADEREVLLDDLIRYKVLEQAAIEAGIASERTIAAELELQRMRLLANTMARRHLQRNRPSSAELRAAYEEHLPRLSATQYKARHILLPSEDRAAAVIAELNEGADFIELERRHSFGPDNEQAGDLGWFTLQDTVPAFAEAIQSMEVGRFSSTPVRTQFGWHVILLEDTQDPEPPPLDAVRDDLAAIVEQQKLEAYIESLKEGADITVEH